MSTNLIEALGGMGGIAQMAQELGVDQQTVQAGAAALMPALMGGFKKTAQGEAGGLEGLVGMLGGMGGGGLLDQVLAPQATPTGPGAEIVGQIFGGAQGAQAVAGHAAAQSGLSADLIMKMMPMLAMAAAGFMAKSASAGTGAAEGGLGGLIGQVTSMLGGGQQAGGMGQIAAMLDMDKDGNPLDDIMGMLNR